MVIMRPVVRATPRANGCLYDLSSLDVFDFTQEKWNKNSLELMTKGDAGYGMLPIPSEPRDGVWFNKRLLEEAGIDPESLYDMQRDGTWTWEA